MWRAAQNSGHAFVLSWNIRQQGRAETSCCGLCRNSRIPAPAFAVTSRTSFSRLVARTWELSRRLPHDSREAVSRSQAGCSMGLSAPSGCGSGAGRHLPWLQTQPRGFSWLVALPLCSSVTSESPGPRGRRFLVKCLRFQQYDEIPCRGVPKRVLAASHERSWSCRCFPHHLRKLNSTAAENEKSDLLQHKNSPFFPSTRC